MVPAAGCQARNFRGSVDVKVLLSSYTWVFWSLFSMPPPILLFDVRWCTSPGVLAGHVFHFSPSLGVSWSLVFGSVFFLHSWFDGFSWCTGSMLSFFVWCYGRWLFFHGCSFSSIFFTFFDGARLNYRPLLDRYFAPFCGVMEVLWSSLWFCFFSFHLSPSIFLTVFFYDAQLDSQRSLDRCFVLCVVLWTVWWSTLWFCFCFFFLLSPASCLTVLFYDARLKSDFLVRHLTDLRTFLPFFALDVTILCLHLS